MWDNTKESVNKLNLSGQLDYLHKLTSQLHWQGNPGDRGIRVLYNQSGTPTAALLESDAVLVDYTLYWIACKDINEANYLMAIINSNALYEMVRSLMPKGQYGARHLQKTPLENSPYRSSIQGINCTPPSPKPEERQQPERRQSWMNSGINVGRSSPGESLAGNYVDGSEPPTRDRQWKTAVGRLLAGE